VHAGLQKTSVHSKITIDERSGFLKYVIKLLLQGRFSKLVRGVVKVQNVLCVCVLAGAEFLFEGTYWVLSSK